jgi:uncharacterized membrane protein
MPPFTKPLAEWCAAVVEVAGLGAITLLALNALIHAGGRLVQRAEGLTVFRETRRRLGRGILLGLELLVAADIIRTVRWRSS